MGIPNAIWIRIPDNSWIHDLENSFQKASEIIQNELKGSNNQRVNSVFVITRIFERFENNGLQYLGYRPVVMKIDHTNPAIPTPNPKTPE